jgi:hypothetical protein
VGSFEFSAGTSLEGSASVSVASFGGGAKAERKRETLNRDGDEKQCGKASAEDAKPPFGCGAVLRIEVVPLGAARKVEPTCSAGTQWDGDQCVAIKAGASCAEGMISDKEKGCVPKKAAVVPVRLDPELRAAIGDHRSEGDLVVPTGALAFIDRVAASLERGYALLIDYGGDTSGPVHGYRRQQPVDDVVRTPGSVDVTAGVDFTWVAEHARSRGLHAFPLVDQTDVLRALGFDSWLRDELATQQDQLARGAGLDAVRTWSMRSRATMLVDPAALGRMRWLLLATEGLPAPLWLDAATQDRTTD